MKIGKIAAVGLGGGVILLHIASQKGYIDINWDKINKKVDKITDKIEKEATGRSPDWFEKVSSRRLIRYSTSEKNYFKIFMFMIHYQILLFGYKLCLFFSCI